MRHFSAPLFNSGCLALALAPLVAGPVEGRTVAPVASLACSVCGGAPDLAARLSPARWSAAAGVVAGALSAGTIAGAEAGPVGLSAAPGVIALAAATLSSGVLLALPVAALLSPADTGSAQPLLSAFWPPAVGAAGSFAGSSAGPLAQLSAPASWGGSASLFLASAGGGGGGGIGTGVGALPVPISVPPTTLPGQSGQPPAVRPTPIPVVSGPVGAPPVNPTPALPGTPGGGTPTAAPVPVVQIFPPPASGGEDPPPVAAVPVPLGGLLLTSGLSFLGAVGRRRR